MTLPLAFQSPKPVSPSVIEESQTITLRVFPTIMISFVLLNSIVRDVSLYPIFTQNDKKTNLAL